MLTVLSPPQATPLQWQWLAPRGHPLLCPEGNRFSQQTVCSIGMHYMVQYSDTMIKAFQYRLYPSRAQERKLEATRITCQKWYNDLLAERKTAYQERGETVGKYAQLRRVKERKAASPWAKDVHSHVLQVVVADLDKAFQAFFRRVKTGKKAGYPRFAQGAPGRD